MSPDQRAEAALVLAASLWGIGALGEMRRTHIVRNAENSARSRGDLRFARELLDDVIVGTRLSRHSQAVFAAHQGLVDMEEGALLTAEEHLQKSYALCTEAGSATSVPALWLAGCMLARSEMQAAKRLLHEVLAYRGKEWYVRPVASRVLAEIHLEEGNVSEALDSLQQLALGAAQKRCDGGLYDAAESIVATARKAHDAVRMDEINLQAILVTISTVEDVALSIAANGPPWYKILFPALRGELLALRPDSMDEAFALLATSLEDARALWSDAAPLHARKFINHLIRADRLEEARSALAIAVPEAAARAHFKELAALQNADVVVLTRTGAASSDLAGAIERLRASFDRSGSRRLTAETLLDLARALPPNVTVPDPLQLLDEAHALFLEMPMPGQEARCLEAMGDVHAARVQAPEARRCYLMAKGICEQYGLGLRLPVLASKLTRVTSAPMS